MSDYEDGFDAIGEDDDLFNGSGDGDSEDALVGAGGGTDGPATAKQIAFAKNIAAATGAPYPAEYEDSRRRTSEYIELNKSEFQRRVEEDPMLGGPSKPPSEKQLSFAKRIAERLSLPIPEGLDTNWRVTSKFIDDHKIAFENAGGGTKPPSEKQINFARMIAERGGFPLPEGLEADWRVAREFIDAHKHVLDTSAIPAGGGGSRGGPRSRRK